MSHEVGLWRDKLTKKNHESDQVARSPAQAQFNSSVPSERDHDNTECRHHDAHGGVWDGLRVLASTREVEGAVIACQQASESDEHLAQRGMHVEVELAPEVVRAELAKVRLVPDHQVGLANLVEARPA